ncbi:MAG: OsmC family protein [Thermoguttaceae bacterium]
MSEVIELTYPGKLRCRATLAASGQELVTDAPRENGGLGEAFSPTDLLAGALGTCLLTVVGIVGQRSNIDLAGMTARIEKEMSSGPVRRVGRIKTVVHMPKGLKLSDAERSKLENAAKLCPVKQSLHPEVEVLVEFVYP